MSDKTSPSIVLVGCGKMGSAMLQSWLEKYTSAHYAVIDPHANAPEKVQLFSTATQAADLIAAADLLILAVKPQIMKDICAEIKPHLGAQTTILSIAAGQTLANFAHYFDEMTPVIRSMPNTPAAIGKGMSVAMSNSYTTQSARDLAGKLLSCAGKVEWIDNEALFDPVTAVSGSGPAYLFFLIEALSEAAQKAGLDAELAQRLARQTIIGAAALAEEDEETPPAILRQNVTSPGGTTAAALEILMNGKWQEILNDAVKAASERSVELSQ